MDNPLIVHISEISQWKKLVREIPEVPESWQKLIGPAR